MSRTYRNVPEYIMQSFNDSLDHIEGDANRGERSMREQMVFELEHGLTKPFNLFTDDGVAVGRRGSHAFKRMSSKRERLVGKSNLRGEIHQSI